MYEHDNYIYHASTGFKWKHHKYIKKIGNKYIYPEDLEKAKKKIAESGATASAKAVSSVGSKTLKKAFNSAKKVNASSGIDRRINKTKKKVDKVLKKTKKELNDFIDPINKAKKKVDKVLKKTKNSAVEKLKKSGHYRDPNEKKEPKILSQKIEGGGKTKYIVEGKTVDKKAYNAYQKKNAPKSNSKPEGKLGKSAIKYENTDGTVTYKIGNKKVSKSQYESYLKKKK